MHWFSIVLGLLFCLILYQGLCFLWKKFMKLPPGPTPLPIIGNLQLLGDQPHQSFAILSEKYGPIMSLKLGTVTTIVVSSPSSAKEVLKKQDLAFSKRSIPDVALALNHSQFSVIWLPVALQWRRLRKIINSFLFSAYRLDSTQHLRREKVQELIFYCQERCNNGEAVGVGQAFFSTLLNLLSNAIFSKDLADPYSDSANEFKGLVWSILEEAGKANLADCFPFLTKFDPQGSRNRMEAHFGKLLNHFCSIIDERLEQKGSRDGIGDVLDELLATNAESPAGIDRDHIPHMFLDIFVAGTDTSSSTMEWAMAELLRNPDKLKKAQAELSGVISKGKAVEETDVVNLPYLRSIVKETLRLHPAAPLLVPRTVQQDIELCGYNVPKGSRVLINAWAIGRNETVWEDPLSFKPERFLASELDFRGGDMELIPFGAGRRICPGLPFAVRTIPVILGSLLNSFNWKLEGSIAPKELDMDEKFGITLQKANPLRVVPCPI